MSDSIYDLNDQFRTALLNSERAAASQMVREYGKAWRVIQKRIEELAAQYYALAETGGKPPISWIYEMDRFQVLQNQVEGEIRKFAQYTEGAIEKGQKEAIAAAHLNAVSLMDAGLPEGAHVKFNRLPKKAFENLVGFLQDGSPLKDLLNQLPGEAGKLVADGLQTGLLLGWNPTRTASHIREALGGNLARALRIARTETLRSYREATRQTYKANNHVVKGWEWRSARNERTCAMCVTGETIVSGPGIQKVFSRYYSGDVVVIKTTSGKYLTVTPNHPIFTRSGWIKAGMLKKGDYVISSTDADGAELGVGVNNYQMPAIIKQIAESFSMIFAEMPCTTPDFHGDGKGSEVYVIRTNSLLKDDIHSFTNKQIEQNNLTGRSVRNPPIFSFLFPFFRSLYALFQRFLIRSGMIIKNWFSFFQRDFTAFQGVVIRKRSSGSIRKSQAGGNCISIYAKFFGKRLFGFTRKIPFGDLIIRKIKRFMTNFSVLFSSNRISLRLISEQATLFKNGSQAFSANSVIWRNFLSGFTRKVRLDRILDVDIRSFSGHVYNLQTTDGWYFANGIITHNCWAMDGTEHSFEEKLNDHFCGRCSMLPLMKSWQELGFNIDEVKDKQPKTGIEAFELLSHTEQMKILGPAKYAAYKDGAFKLSDLVGETTNSRWGSMRYEKSLVELGLSSNEWLAKYRENPAKELIPIQEAVDQILEIHREKDGATFSLFHGNMAGKPYRSVSIFPDLSATINGKEITQEQLQNFISTYEGLARNSKVGIGTWYNADEDVTYLDFVVLIQDREFAISLGKQYNQIGIFDLEKMEYIEVGGTGKSIDGLLAPQDRLKEIP
jgi:hypothetical protein